VRAGTLAAARLHVALPNFRVLCGIRPPANASGTGPKLDALAELEGEMLQHEKGDCVNMCAYRERKVYATWGKSQQRRSVRGAAGEGGQLGNAARSIFF